MEGRILEEFGLNNKESKIYLALLKERKCTASKLAKITKINRTTAYLELDNLIRMGLVSFFIKDSKRYYQASPPEKFLDILDTKKARIESILPRLRGLHKTAEPLKIEVFEGKEGIKTFYQDVLSNAKEVLVFGATGRAMQVLRFSYPNLLKKGMKAGITERALANIKSKKIMEVHPKSHIKVRYLPEQYHAYVTTAIYNNKVAIQSLQKDNIYVIVISDKLLYQSYKHYFEFMWKLAK